MDSQARCLLVVAVGFGSAIINTVLGGSIVVIVVGGGIMYGLLKGPSAT